MHSAEQAQEHTNGTNGTTAAAAKAPKEKDVPTLKAGTDEYKTEQRRLFMHMIAAEEKKAAAEEALKACDTELSDVVGEIYVKLGQKPYRVRDRLLTPWKRKGGGYYMRGPNESSTEDVGV